MPISEKQKKIKAAALDYLNGLPGNTLYDLLLNFEEGDQSVYVFPFKDNKVISVGEVDGGAFCYVVPLMDEGHYYPLDKIYQTIEEVAPRLIAKAEGCDYESFHHSTYEEMARDIGSAVLEKLDGSSMAAQS